jgi:excisionase family DNA binding protein
VNERLMDAREVAAFLGVSRQQVYLLAERGELPSFKIGFLRRFSTQALREWLERHAEGEPAA